MSDRVMDPALERLGGVLAGYDRLVVAFSGGADSALLSYVATSVLGREAVICATAVSASLAPDELEDTTALAKEWDLRHVTVATHELENPSYVANTLERCFFCKDELMNVLAPLAASEDSRVALGVNLDDLGEWRPGQRAAREAGAVFPLVDAKLDKETVRAVSRDLGLRTWNKPAAACLSSRVPHGTPVTVSLLGQVARAEQSLHRLGLRQLRVRHYGDAARVEIAEEELGHAFSLRAEIVEAVKAAGYRYVTLDLEGFRSGNLSLSALAESTAEVEK